MSFFSIGHNEGLTPKCVAGAEGLRVTREGESEGEQSLRQALDPAGSPLCRFHFPSLEVLQRQ